MEFPKWSHHFAPESPKVYEDEVRSFYTGLFVVDEATLCLTVNGKDFILDEYTLGKILEVPSHGMRTVEGNYFLFFEKANCKKEGQSIKGEDVQDST